MIKILTITFLILSFACNAVVKRHEVQPEVYEVKKIPDFFIDMPHEGAAVLVDKYWLVTAAHVVFYDYHDKPIMLHGVENRIERVVFHHGYKKDPGNWGQGDAKPLTDFLSNRDDIVLLKLAEPVEHLKPISRYYDNKEIGEEATIFGRGATGTGLTGEILTTQEPSLWESILNTIRSPFTGIDETQANRTLNNYKNIIESANENWFMFRFDRADDALPLEGSVGSGDSGGPAIVVQDGMPLLIGLASWQEYEGDLKDYVGGKYGAVSVFVRISSYNQWIDKTISTYSNKT